MPPPQPPQPPQPIPTHLAVRPTLLLEIVAVDALDLHHALGGDAQVVLHHELRQALAVNQHQRGVGVQPRPVAGGLGVAAGGDEDAAYLSY